MNTKNFRIKSGVPLNDKNKSKKKDITNIILLSDLSWDVHTIRRYPKTVKNVVIILFYYMI